MLLVDAIFCLVTWHSQRRPFVRILACKTAKARQELAREASSEGQVSQVSKEGGERERESKKNRF
jgi:exosome complex RNA-binding protein Csl4